MESFGLGMARRCARLLPAPLRRAIRLHRFRRLPDRVYLESRILPWLAARGVTQLLSVGCQDYTAHYGALLRRLGVGLSTADLDPQAAAFGASHHLRKSVTALVAADFPRLPDGVLLNGVIGWGLDAPAEIEAGFAALARLLPAQAPLVVGWNLERAGDPAALPACRALFRRCAGPTGETRVAIPGSTHVYDFFLRAPG